MPNCLPTAIQSETKKSEMFSWKTNQKYRLWLILSLFCLEKGSIVIFSGHSEILMIFWGVFLATSAHSDHLRMAAFGHWRLPFLIWIMGKKDPHKYPAQKHLIKFTREQFCFLRQHWALGVREMNLWADCVVSVVAYCHFKTWQVPWLLCDTVSEIAFGKNCPCIQLYIHFSLWYVCIFQYIVHFKSDESSTCCTDTHYLW